MNSRLLCISLILVFLFGCTTASKNSMNLDPGKKAKSRPVQPSILPPQPPAEDMINDEVPVMSFIEKNAPYHQYENRKYSLDLQSGDIKDVLLALIRETDIGLVIEPGISGTIPVMDLKDATLKEILSYILPPLKLHYKWEGKNLHIYRVRLVTRYFSMNYLGVLRKGKREVSFSTRSGSAGTGSSGGGSGGSGGGGGGSGDSGGGGQNQSMSQVTVEYENFTWQAFIDSMKVLVFGTVEEVEQHQVTNTEQNQEANSGDEIAKSFAFRDPVGRMMIINCANGLIVVRAYEDELEEVARFIESYEGAYHRQVWIEAKIVEVNLHKAYQMGIDWGVVANRGGYYGTLDNKRTLVSPAMTFTPGTIEDQGLASNAGSFQFAVSNNILDVMLDAIARQGNLKVLASPRISTLNNEKAVIRVVREEAFFNLQTQVSQGVGGNVTAPTINVQVVPIGIVMDIIPQISEDGTIMLSVNPDISELLETRRFEVEGAMATQPVIDRRSIDTVARIKDGETLVIAGIIKERKSEVIKGVPLLYKIPLLGNLFRRTEQRTDRTELVIFITPRVQAGRSFQQLTNEERERIKNALKPLHFGDTAPILEGLSGEIDDFKKNEKSEEF